LLIVAALAALALIVAGCGGDEDDEPLTKDEFLTLADQICADADTELNEEAEQRFGNGETLPPRDEQEEFISDVLAPSYQEQLDAIGDLTPPEADQEQVDAILVALQDLADQARDAPGELLDQPPTEAAELAQAYGFTACGS
jgi:hypothetical protein